MKPLSGVNEDQPDYVGFVNRSEDEKLRENIMRSPMEKLQLFTKTLRREYALSNAKIAHL